MAKGPRECKSSSTATQVELGGRLVGPHVTLWFAVGSGQEIPVTRTIYLGAHPENLRARTQILCVGGWRLASRVFGADWPYWMRN